MPSFFYKEKALTYSRVQFLPLTILQFPSYRQGMTSGEPGSLTVVLPPGPFGLRFEDIAHHLLGRARAQTDQYSNTQTLGTARTVF